MFQLRKSSIVIIVGACMAVSSTASGEDLLNNFVAVLPQVAKGTSNGVSIESLVVLMNPQEVPVQASISSTDAELTAPTDYLLQPYEKRELRLGEGSLKVGSIIVRADKPLLVSANLITRDASTQEIQSELVMSGQKLGSMAVIPVYRDGIVASETSFAIYFDRPGTCAFRLWDDSGASAGNAGRIQVSANTHTAAFVEEVLKDLSDKVTKGTLVIQFADYARAFATTAVYSKNDRLWTAPAEVVDILHYYRLQMKSEYRTASVINQLKDQYGFLPFDSLAPVDNFLILATDEIARAVARDPRVEAVSVTHNPVQL